MSCMHRTKATLSPIFLWAVDRTLGHCAHHWGGVAGRVAVERDGFPLGDDQVRRVLQDDRGRVRLRVIPGGVGQQVRVAEVI